MTSTFIRVELVHVTSCCCRIEFGIPRDFYDDCNNYGTSFHCPKCGNSMVFREPETKRLRKEIKILNNKVNNADRQRREAENQKNAARKSHRKMRDRVKNGVCPCCNRSFENLLNHMRSKHPEFGNNKTLKQLRETYGLTQGDLASELGVSVNYISRYECGHAIASWATDQIESWIEEQGKV